MTARLEAPLTVTEVAAKLGMSRRWVQQQIASGALGHTKFGVRTKVYPDQLAAFVGTCRRDGQPAGAVVDSDPDAALADVLELVPAGALTSRSRSAHARNAR